MADQNKSKPSYEEKLNKVNEELRLLTECCLKRGYGPTHLEKSAKPFLRDLRAAQKRQTGGILLTIAILVGVCAVLFSSDPARRLILASSRLSVIKVVSLFDWTGLYGTECILRNPLVLDRDSDRSMSIEDCQACKSLNRISAVHNISMEDMSEKYLKQDIPVVVTDGMRDWSTADTVNIHYLQQLFAEHKVLKMYMGCQFESNVQVQFGDHRTFLRMTAAGEAVNYYARWMNCFKESSKALREIYRRPYCLPPMIELLDTNWVFVSSHYKAEKDFTLPIPMEGAFLMLLQLSGEITVNLEPVSICAGHCQQLSVRLQKGQLLFLTDYLYRISYVPSDKADCVTVAVGGEFD